MTPPVRRRGEIAVEELERTTGELRRTLAEMRAERSRDAVDSIKRRLEETERALGDARKLRAEPSVDAAIEDGRIARDSRDVWLEAAAAGFDVKRQLAARQPDALLASHNYFLADDNDANYKREAAARLGPGLSSEDLV